MTNEEIFETLSNVYMTPQEHRAWKELYTKVTKYEDDKDMKEITEIMKCDADAETKCKMISEIVNGKPHYFKEQESCENGQVTGK